MGPVPGFWFWGREKICGGAGPVVSYWPRRFFCLANVYHLSHDRGVFRAVLVYCLYTIFSVNPLRYALILGFLFSPDSPLRAGIRRFESARPDQQRSGTSLNNPPQFPN